MEQLFSTKEVSDLLGVSSVQVFRLIQDGKIEAKKIGHSFVISKSALDDFLINRPVRKAIQDFGDTLRRLGKE